MKKFLAALLLLLGTSVSAEPFVSPQTCQVIAGEIIAIATLRDEQVPEAKMLDDLRQAVPDEKEVAFKFYSFWIKSIYASKMSPEDMGMAFYLACFKAEGDIAKLMGDEV